MITQPDGTTRLSHERGDEFFHWEESTDGYVIMLNSQGVMEYATKVGDQLLPSGVKVHNVKDKSSAEISFAKDQLRSTKSAITQYANDEQKRMMPRPRIVIPTDPVIGTRKILTVLVGFQGYSCTYSVANFDSLMNYVNYSGHGNAGSVRDFYYENSYGQ